MIELSFGVITNGLVSSNSRLQKANGDPGVAAGLNVFTLGLESKTSVDLSPVMSAISFVYLSEVNEFTVNKSPLFPDGTSYWSNITSNRFAGMAEPSFLTILE